mmetsp:Transcript_35144/g.100082  ORF Transcript_35144/g.100082 Transcript_35144/m.100082 type:complete len:307 (+) Transcript_35144:324-1244(+)
MGSHAPRGVLCANSLRCPTASCSRRCGRGPPGRRPSARTLRSASGEGPSAWSPARCGWRRRGRLSSRACPAVRARPTPRPAPPLRGRRRRCRSRFARRGPCRRRISPHTANWPCRTSRRSSRKPTPPGSRRRRPRATATRMPGRRPCRPASTLPSWCAPSSSSSTASCSAPASSSTATCSAPASSSARTYLSPRGRSIATSLATAPLWAPPPPPPPRRRRRSFPRRRASACGSGGSRNSRGRRARSMGRWPRATATTEARPLRRPPRLPAATLGPTPAAHRRWTASPRRRRCARSRRRRRNTSWRR